jgi:hypothetical protein
MREIGTILVQCANLVGRRAVDAGDGRECHDADGADRGNHAARRPGR